MLRPGFGPGSPTRKASILDRTILPEQRLHEFQEEPQPHKKTLLQQYQQEAYIIRNKQNAKPQDSAKIANALITMKTRHLDEHTIKLINYRLCELSAKCDLSTPTTVESYIETKKKIDGKDASNNYKNALLKAYYQYTKTNSINWKPKFYRVLRVDPILPTQKSIDLIINNSNLKYQTIFTILDDTGAEGKELETVNAKKQIDIQQGIISFKGCKMHNPRSIKLKQKTTHLLRQYLAKYTDEYPFPPSRYYGENWLRTKKKLAKRLNMPELLRTDVRHLRHFSGSKFYQEAKDLIATSKRLGHKKWETTKLYVQLLVTEGEEQYISVAVKENDIETAIKLTNEGYTVNAEMTGYKIFKKRK